MAAEVGLTVAESTPQHPTLPRAATGSPNVLMIVLDDMGFAQLGCFGSDIATPHIDALAGGGLTYNRYHVTALCSPTRACLLTGRNHHAVGMGFLADMSMGFPGYTARIPQSAATLPRVLRDSGWSTMAMGKWHLTPRGERSAAGPFDHWPSGLGFEHHYGVLHGGTNFWTPNLVSGNRFLDPPETVDPDYHFSVDIADQTIRSITDQKHAAPDKPFMCYYAEVATHAPHHVPEEWVEPYRGAFDDGWERWRARTFERQVASGIVPEGTTLTNRPPWVQDWDALDDDARRLFARMHEVYAGFLSHTDAQIGRVIEHLRSIGELDNTIIMLSSDNGASAEGGVVGSVNEHRFTKQLPESVEENLRWYDDLGGPKTYNHYAWGWAWAGNTPFRLWKRYSWLGGTRTPLIVHWPDGIAARGEVRSQFAHAIDLMPTVLDACGIEPPAAVDGVEQQPIDGASLLETFSDADAPSPRERQYFEVQGSRSMYLDGWKATTNHVGTAHGDEMQLIEGSFSFTDDRWSLFHEAHDFSEAHDLADERPDKLAELEAAWWEEADRNNVLPLDDGFMGRAPAITPPAYPAPSRARYRPGAGGIADEMLPVLLRGFELVAIVDVPRGGAEGVLAAMGDWSSGWAVFVNAGHLVVDFCLSGDHFRAESADPVSPGAHRLGCRYRPTSPETATLELVVDDGTVASVTLDRTIPNSWQNGGTALRIGHDAGFPVTDEYAVPFRWTGSIESVEITTPGAATVDPAQLQQESLKSE